MATCNAIRQAGADPIFCDVSNETLGLCPKAVEEYLKTFADMRSNQCIQVKQAAYKGRCGNVYIWSPRSLARISKLCSEWNLIFAEDLKVRTITKESILETLGN